MSKAFTKEVETEDTDEAEAVVEIALPGGRNYLTRAGFLTLRKEFEALVKTERPDLVKVVAWAAGNGDRSENGDYIYGKKRLREMDRRIRYLTQRIESAVVVDPAAQEQRDQVFFGATVTLRFEDEDAEATYQIVGIDEANVTCGRISWVSPLARALMKARLGETIRFDSPAGVREAEIIAIYYG